MRERQTLIAHSSIREYEFDGDDEDRYYLPWRATVEAAARTRLGQRVVTLLPQHQPFREFLDLIEKELLPGQKLDLRFTSDSQYLLDRDIQRELLPDLVQTVEPGAVLHPYQATDEFLSWASVLQRERSARVFSDRQERENRMWWGHKGAYHRWMDNLETPGIAEILDLPFPRGFVAQDEEELGRAVDLLEADGVVLKPIFGAGGFQMGFFSAGDSMDGYSWPEDPIHGGKMPIAVQERLPIKNDSRGERIFSLQFNGSSLFGPLTRQIANHAEWNGNMVPAGVTRSFDREATEIAGRFLKGVGPKGNGGIDIADVNGHPIILEVNGGRPTGAHAPKYFKEAFAPNSTHFLFEKVDSKAHSAQEVWDLLNSKTVPNSTRSLALDFDTQRGVFPIVWLQGSWAMLASFGETTREVQRQMQIAKEVTGR